MSRGKKFLMQILRETQLEQYSYDDLKLMMEKFHTEIMAETLFQKALIVNGIFSESLYKDFFVVVYETSRDGKKTILFEYDESDGEKALRLYNIGRLSEVSKEIAGASLELKPLFRESPVFKTSPRI